MAPAVAPLPGYLGYIIQITRSLQNCGELLCVTDAGIPEKNKPCCVSKTCYENTSHHVFPRVGNQQVQQGWTLRYGADGLRKEVHLMTCKRLATRTCELVTGRKAGKPPRFPSLLSNCNHLFTAE